MPQQMQLAALAAIHSTGPKRAYNLFRRKQEQDLFCAVPEDRPVPAFLDGEQWEYAATVTEAQWAPAGFREGAARSGSDNNGFYLFYTHVRHPH